MSVSQEFLAIGLNCLYIKFSGMLFNRLVIKAEGDLKALEENYSFHNVERLVIKTLWVTEEVIKNYRCESHSEQLYFWSFKFAVYMAPNKGKKYYKKLYKKYMVPRLGKISKFEEKLLINSATIKMQELSFVSLYKEIISAIRVHLKRYSITVFVNGKERKIRSMKDEHFEFNSQVFRLLSGLIYKKVKEFIPKSMTISKNDLGRYVNKTDIETKTITESVLYIAIGSLMGISIDAITGPGAVEDRPIDHIFEIVSTIGKHKYEMLSAISNPLKSL